MNTTAEEFFDDGDSPLLTYVLNKAKNLGMSTPDRPVREPGPPGDVTTLTPQQLMAHYQYYQEATAYGQSQLAQANTDVVAKKNRYKKARALKLVEIKEDGYDELGKKIPIKEIEARLETDEELDQLYRGVVTAEQFEVVVKSIVSGYEAKATIFSRELTRRTSQHSYKES